MSAVQREHVSYKKGEEKKAFLLILLFQRSQSTAETAGRTKFCAEDTGRRGTRMLLVANGFGNDVDSRLRSITFVTK